MFIPSASVQKTDVSIVQSDDSVIRHHSHSSASHPAYLYVFLLVRSFSQSSDASTDWGALWKTHELSSGLHGWVVNLDGGIVGQDISQAFAAVSGQVSIVIGTRSISNLISSRDN